MAFQADSIYWVEVEKIVPNPFQPRREFDAERLQELAESIRMYGVLQPLTVSRREIQKDNGAFFTEYELIAGERRLRASKLAGIEQVPVIIRSGKNTEQEKLELAIIENLQREDLNAVDRALAFQQLADLFKLSYTQVAKKIGRSREYVSNSVRLLALPEYILDSVRRAELSEGHARSLLMLKDRPEEQDVVYREILLKKLSVRDVERITRKIATDKVRKKQWLDTDPVLIEIEREFTNTLGTRVQIAKTDYGGKVTIDYFSDTDLHQLLALIKEKRSHSLLDVSVSDDGEVDPSVNVQQLSQAKPLVPEEDQLIENDNLSQTYEEVLVNTEEYRQKISDDYLTNNVEDEKVGELIEGVVNDLSVEKETKPPISEVSEDVGDRWKDIQYSNDFLAEEDMKKPEESDSTRLLVDDSLITSIERAFYESQNPKAEPSYSSRVEHNREPKEFERKDQAEQNKVSKSDKGKEDDSDLYSIRNFSL